MQPMQQGPDGTPPAMPDGINMGEAPSFPEGDTHGTPPARPDSEGFEGQPSFPEGGPGGPPPAFPENSENGNPPGFSEDTAGIPSAPPAENTDSPTAMPAAEGEPDETLPENADDTAASAGETGVSSAASAPSEPGMMRMERPESRNPEDQPQGGPMAHGYHDSQADETVQTQDTGTKTSDWLFTAASVLILAAGILFAVCFRRSQHIEA